MFQRQDLDPTKQKGIHGSGSGFPQKPNGSSTLLISILNYWFCFRNFTWWKPFHFQLSNLTSWKIGIVFPCVRNPYSILESGLQFFTVSLYRFLTTIKQSDALDVFGSPLVKLLCTLYSVSGFPGLAKAMPIGLSF